MAALDQFTQAYNLFVSVLGASAPDLDNTSGSVIDALGKAQCSLIANFQYTLAQMQQNASPSTATGAPLAQQATDRGIKIQGALPAVGSVNVTVLSGAPGGQIIIAQGTRFWTNTTSTGVPIFFISTSQISAVSPGTTAIPITAQNPGASGNVAANSIVNVDNIPYVNSTSVTNPSPTTGGQNFPSDTQLRNLILQQNAVKYSANDIAAAATGTGGAAYAAVNDPKNGSAAITVYAAAQDGSLSTSLNTAVTAAVAAVMPPGITFTLSAMTMVHWLMAVNLEPASGYSSAAVSANVVTAIQNFVGALANGATCQPYQVALYVSQNVSGVQDLVVTSTIPTVPDTNHLLRFLPPPTSLQCTILSTGGSITAGTYLIAITWYCDSITARSGPTNYVTVVVASGTTNSIQVTCGAAPDTIADWFTIYASASPATPAFQINVAITPSAAVSWTLTSIAVGGSTPPTTSNLSAPTITIVTV